MGASKEDFAGTSRFLIQRHLGAGAFGVVYEAYDRDRNALVALKVLKIEDPDALYRFKREFRSLAGVIHPNLVTLYEMFNEGSTWFFTMSLIDGPNFLEFVRPEGADANNVDSLAETRRNGDTARADEIATTRQDVSVRTPPQYDLLRSALRQLAEGIRALHRAGKLHRDLKPSNVKVTHNGRVVILDFGLLSDLPSHGVEQSLAFAGTPAYMSPEQAGNRHVTPASDWYCVGVMLYEALTGELPFTGYVWDIIEKKCNTDPRPPSELIPDVPADLNALCQDLLQRDPARRPLGDEVLLRLGSDGPDGTRPTEAPRVAQPFVGRSEQLSVLGESLDEVKLGRGVSVFVSGRSGMGKSALVHNFLDTVRLREPSAVILEGRCYEQESVPYKALDSLVDVLSRYLKLLPPAEVAGFMPRDIRALSRLFPVLRQVNVFAQVPGRVREFPDMQVLKRYAFEALRELFAKLADQKTLILFIDDIQWGDLDSISLLGEFLRPPDPPPLLLVVAYRAEDVDTSPPLQTLLQLRDSLGASVQIRELSVRELSHDEARGLTLELLGDGAKASDQQVEAVVRESGASPFFIHEFSRYLLTRPAQDGAGSLSRAEDMGAGEATLAEVLWTRITRLPAHARVLLELIAVAGRPIPLEAIKRATEQSIVEHQSLAVLRAQHLIRVKEMRDWVGVETYHDRVRETVLAHLSPAQLTGYHQSLAAALETLSNIDLETLAIHFQGAGDERKAAQYYASAANQAAEALAFNRAARLYRLALQLSSSQDDNPKALRRDLADALVNAGRGSEAAREYAAIAEQSAGAEALEMQQRAAEQFLRSGHIDKGLAVLRTLLGKVNIDLPQTSRRALTWLLLRRAQIWWRGLKFREMPPENISAEHLIKIDICWTAAVGLSTVDTVRGAYFQALHLLLALKAGEPYRLTRALATEAGFSSTSGGRNTARTRKLTMTASEAAAKIKHPHAIGIATLATGLSDFFSGRWKSARASFEEAETVLSEGCKGVAWELNMTRFYTFVSLIYMGEMAEATRRLPALLADAQERGDIWAITNLRTLVSYMMYLVADDVERAKSEAAQAIELWSHEGLHNQHWHNLLAQGEIALYSQEGEAAWRLVTQQYRGLKNSLLLRPQVSFISAMRLRARCALAAASSVESEEVREKLLQSAERDARKIELEKMPWARGPVNLLYAGIAATRGDHGRVCDLLDRAAADSQSADMSLFAAVTRRRRGECTGGESGVAMIEEAEAWMSSQKIKNPERISAMLAPGKWPRR